MNTEEQDCGLSDAPCTYTQVDRWIQSRLHEVTKTTSHAIDNYRFDLAAQAIMILLGMNTAIGIWNWQKFRCNRMMKRCNVVHAKRC